MAEQAVKLGDIIGLEILVDERWTCLAKPKTQARCQKSEQERKWLDLWRARLEEPHVRQRRRSYDSAIALDEPEELPSEAVAMIPSHETYEIAHIPAIVQYPTLPLETPPVPTNAPVRTTDVASYLDRTNTLNIIEDVSDQTAEVVATSQPSVLGHDAPLAPNQTSSPENLGLSVFFSPNQLEVINTIFQFSLQLCAFFQVQYGVFVSRDGAGNKRTESFLQFKLIFGVKFGLSEILTSPWIMFPLAVALGQLMYILIGPWASLMLFLFVALVGSCWTGTKRRLSFEEHHDTHANMTVMSFPSKNSQFQQSIVGN
ncbi:hypothetical protein N7486_009776 [Penicillium sp. IBT 16267x]|nr:hypothetical protein N7486_009776 [Penicillium sp. IBT 16267x]